MPGRKWLHHSIDVLDASIEVWSDDPIREGDPRVVVLYFDRELSHVNITPNEARALASLLVVAAECQERKS
jgi:hypothetical protein